MEIKHTPGPWVPGWYDATETFKQRIAEKRQCAIVSNDNPDNGIGMLIAICGDFDDPQSRKDAIILSAALELKQALQGMITWAEQSVAHSLGDEFLPRGFDKWKQLLERISKLPNEISTDQSTNPAG